MVKYIIFAAVEIGVLVWVIEAIRSKVRHEITMSIGYFLFMALCFENFGTLLPFQYWKVDSVIALKIIGFVLLGVGIVMALTTFFTMKSLGKPKKGWEDTTQLIETGVFSLVRHPMYLASGLLVFGSVLISQHWLTLLLGVPLLVGFPIIVLRADKDLIEKFGDDYKRYMQKVPSVNFLSGIIRARRRNLE